MGTIAVGQFLRSFCNNSDWKYAIFWKRKYHQNQTKLIWDDGYCDTLTPRKSSGSISDKCPVELALSDMACVHYVMGDGVIGEVAYRGTYCWISCADFLANKNVQLAPEFPDEWIPQVEAGIKTILLVAVAPYGVLQLGSLEVDNSLHIALLKDGNTVLADGLITFKQKQKKVLENLALLACIREEFSAIQNCHIPMFCTSNNSSDAQSSPSLESIRTNHVDATQLITQTHLNDMRLEDVSDEALDLPVPLTPNNENVMQLFSIEDLLGESGDAFLGNILDLARDVIDHPFSSLCDVKEEEWETFAHYNNSFVELCDGLSSGNINSYLLDGIIENSNEEDDVDANHLAAGNAFGVPSSADELYEAFNSDFRSQPYDRSPDFLCDDVSYGNANLLFCESDEQCAKSRDVENLLGAVVASACTEMDKSLFNRYNSFKSMSADSKETFTNISVHELHFDQSTKCEDESDLWNHVTTTDLPLNGGSSANLSSVTSIKSAVDKLINDHLQNEANGDKQSSRSKPILRKTRDKPLEKQKRRPRDRQLIQDRLKVLRDLVPNGEKFSIDGLLDRTIKHMMFLRKVSDQSHKLRSYQEVDGVVKLRSSLNKDSLRSGSSWGYQAGSEHDVFPIVVEDLDCPGHMLIEMLCNEHDLFLEVAQVICGLDLTIVKGGMKTRSHNSWAQFVVEVHKGFQRMDVFWPLMQLLQRNPKPISK